MSRRSVDPEGDAKRREDLHGDSRLDRCSNVHAASRGNDPGATPRRAGHVAPLLIALLACLALSRFWGLDAQAFHHDESIHAKAIWDFVRAGPSSYHYNPVYHGPLFYHAGALFSDVLPDTDFTARLPFAIAGCFLVAACLLLQPLAGWRATCLVLALLIVSPTVTYYSRFARGDVWMMAWLAAVIGSGALYLKTARLRWLSLAWLCVVLAYCTKENSYVNHALVCTFVVGLGIWRLAKHPRRGLHDIVVRYLPLTRLLVIFGCASAFTFLYIAIDCRMGREAHWWSGLVRIARHSVALTREANSGATAGNSIVERGFFTGPGREAVRQGYLLAAFAIPVLVLGIVEGISARVKRLGTGAIAVRALLGWIGYGAAAVWVFEFALWAGRYSGGAFLDVLRGKILVGGLLLGGLALLAAVPTLCSPTVRRRTGRGWKRWRVLIRLLRPTLFEFWALGFQVLLALAVYGVLFSSLGTNTPAGLRAGIYDYIAYWFRQQTGEFRIWGPWWYYLPRLLLYEFGAVTMLIVAGTALVVRRRKLAHPASLRMTVPPASLIVFSAWLAIGTMVIYALLNEKVYWLGIYQAFALNLFAAFLFARWLALEPRRVVRIAGFLVAVPAVLFSLWQHALAVHLYPDRPSEPMAYVTTSQEYKIECQRIVAAQRNALNSGASPFVTSLSGEGVWPAAWYLRRTPTTSNPFDPGAAVLVVDDSPMNRRRLSFSSDSLWNARSVPVRGWWFGYGEGLPAGLNFGGNLTAFFMNAENDRRDAFGTAPQAPDPSYPTGFGEQILRFALFRELWYPVAGTHVLFAWRTGRSAATQGTVLWLDGFDRHPKESTVVDQIGAAEGHAGSLRAPRGLTILPNGDLAVADSGNGRIQVFRSDGEWVRSIGEGILSRDITGPCGVAAGPDGSLYVADTWNHAVRRFTQEGKLVATCGHDPEDGQTFDFYGPRGIAVAGQNGDTRVYVTDTGNKRVVVLDRDLRPLGVWGGPGSGPGQFDEPIGICRDAEGSLYVADTGNGRIQRFTTDGVYVEEYIVYAPLKNEVVAIEPNLAVLPDGRRLAMTWSTIGILEIVDPSSRSAWPWKPSGAPTEPVGIAVAPDWSMFVTDRLSSRILKLTDRPMELAPHSSGNGAPSP